MLLLIDNYDSFTYTIAQYLQELGAELYIIKNDQLSIQALQQLRPEKIVISPGPGTPHDAGLSLSAITFFAQKRVPILGVCLGHQAIAVAFGGKVQFTSVMHGKTSAIYHQEKSIFLDLPSPFRATRYHSLIVDPNYLPPVLEVIAWSHHPRTNQYEIMAIKHKIYPIVGVQFHPEAILSEQGHNLFANFLSLS